LLTLRQLSRNFTEGARVHRVLAGVEAQVGSGETVAIMGRSGSGKSTLLNLISGIDRPDSGSVHVDGLEVSALGEPARTLFRRAHIGFVYQFFNLIPTLDVAENVRLVLELNGVGGAAARTRSLAALAAVGLAARARSAVEDLSGGEQQRVAIARALINQPKLILADEPTGNLDEANEEIVLQLFRELHGSGHTILLVTHSAAIGNMADRRIELAHGRLAQIVANAR
jgi:putative ABC transport system ATP-binding protein